MGHDTIGDARIDVEFHGEGALGVASVLVGILRERRWRPANPNESRLVCEVRTESERQPPIMTVKQPRMMVPP